MIPRPPSSPLFPYTTLFRSAAAEAQGCNAPLEIAALQFVEQRDENARAGCSDGMAEGHGAARSEEHTSELQSRGHLVCRLLLEKKKTKQGLEYCVMLHDPKD